MPWYWSDEIARVLLGIGKIDAVTASRLIAAPVAFRLDSGTVEAAAESLLDDEEIPLLAA